MNDAVHYRIMLVDDDRFLLDMYAKKFTDEGHEVQTCPSVQEAIQALEGGYEADAIVLDLVMPKAGGYDLLEAVRDRKLAPNAAIVVLTNQSVDEEGAKVESLGAHEYIVKASTIPSEVYDTIIGVIGRLRRDA